MYLCSVLSLVLSLIVTHWLLLLLTVLVLMMMMTMMMMMTVMKCKTLV